MSLHAVARWIVTYDISDNSRLVRVHRHLRRHGVPLQYSVFVVETSAAGMKHLLAEVRALIAWSHDDVRAYRWPAEPELYRLGCELLAPGVLVGAACLESAHAAQAMAPARHARRTRPSA
ncbi:MAG: hypothetical protein RLY71_2406 [Pseudomonadota bacterium]|jgi:CRISPR-associated protein Cas2